MVIVSNNGVLINYRVIGNGKPLVLLHGIHGSGWEWEEFGFVEKLKAFQVILIDLRGHGKSSKLRDPLLYDPKLQASDIICVLNDLDLNNAIVWGYSYGARIAFAVGIYYPEFVAQLIIGGMHPYPVTNLYSKIEHRQNLLRSGLRKYLDGMKMTLSEVQIKKFLENDQLTLVQLDESILGWDGFGDDLENLKASNFAIILYIGGRDRAYLEKVNKFLIDFPQVKYVEIKEMNHFEVLKDSKAIISYLYNILLFQ